MPNPYLDDSKRYLHQATDIVVSGLNDDNSTCDAILYAALGMERLLKALLHNINPLYVYKNQDFKNSIPILYADSLVPEDACSEISKNPDTDVYSFRAALVRCRAISKTASTHSALLFRLSSQLDIIAHCLTSQLDISMCRQLMQRDYFSLLNDFASEFKIDALDLLGPRKLKIQAIAADNQIDLAAKIAAKLGLHKNKWEVANRMEGYADTREKNTRNRLDAMTSSSLDVTTIACPACSNFSMVRLEADYEYTDHESVFMGVFATELRCLFCKLHVTEYDELDYLGIQRVATAVEEIRMDQNGE